MWELLFLLLPLAAFSGWIIGKRKHLRSLDFFYQKPQKKSAEAFIHWLETNQETVDTHLTLGSLFRRRGEVDKAIGIHQNLIAKPSLTQEQRSLSLLELSRDYMRAGVLDRAENILLELVKEDRELESSYQHLIEIYQQSKEWLRAIEIALKLQVHSKKNMNHHIAHFYCELAEQRWLKGERQEAYHYLKNALASNTKCVRASLLLGNIESNLGNYKAAIKSYHQVKFQDPAFLSEIINPLNRCYEALNQSEKMVKYLTDCLRLQPTLSVVLAFSEWIHKSQGEDEAIKFVVEHLRQYPSIRGIDRLIQFKLAQSESVLGSYAETTSDLRLLQELLQKLMANKSLYRCQACGFSGRTLQWQCPGCKRWDVIKPICE